MPIYKVIFANNTIVSCEVTNNTVTFPGNYYYEQTHGHPIHALIRAESLEDAEEIADQVVKEITEKFYGQDFIL